MVVTTGTLLGLLAQRAIELPVIQQASQRIGDLLHVEEIHQQTLLLVSR